MKTVYDLYHWSTDGAVFCDPDVPRFNTLDEARAAAGHPNPDDWHITPSGSRCLRPEVAEPLGYVKGRPWAISDEQIAETDPERIELALRLAASFGQTDGDHHKAWVIDQIVRTLTGDGYEQWIVEYRAGEDGPDTYSWDEGIAP